MISQIKKFVSSLVKSPLNSRTQSVFQIPNSKFRQEGFTLLELLIVISIIAILSVALVLVLDPAETLRKSRDAQRISDMSTIKTALGIYTTSTTTPYLGGNATNATCKTTPTAAYVAANRIFYSIPGGATTITDTSLDGGTVTASTTVLATYTTTDGTGWIPVNFDSLIGGSPISNLPIDPINSIGVLDSATTISTSTMAYRYACSITPLAYEIDAVLESTTYTSSDNKLTKDGGNSDNYYEVGTNLKILGAGGAPGTLSF